jgi:putative triacylglycerol lipase
MTAQRHRLKNFVAATLAATMLAGSCISTGEANATPIFDDTPLGPFFNVSQAKLDSVPNGTLIRIRPVSNFVVQGTQVFQYVFKTTNSHGKAVLASAGVMRPIIARPNNNVLIYNDFINSLGVECQPSFAFNAAADYITTAGRTPNAARKAEITTRNASLIGMGALAAVWGITTIFPDFLGLQSAYGANILGGHITLDAIKAARQVKHLNIPNPKIILSGYSGGAMVAAYAAAMAPTYAPNLNIVGMAAGGMPADMVWMGKALGNNRHPGFGIIMGAMLGLEREYPNRMNVYNRLSKKGKRIVNANRDACTPRMLDAMKNESATTMFNNVKLREQHNEFKVFAENSIINYKPAPRVPTFLWSSDRDDLVPIHYIRTVTKHWCATSPHLKVQLVDTHVFNHVANATVGAWIAFPWVLGRFAGIPPKNTEC